MYMPPAGIGFIETDCFSAGQHPVGFLVSGFETDDMEREACGKKVKPIELFLH